MTRTIESKMIAFLDAKLLSNGLAQDAIQNKRPRTLFACAMEACVGIREVGGNNEGPLVELIQETLGGADKEPWCMSLVQTCLAYAEVKTGILSPIFSSEHCLTVWKNTPIEQRVKKSPLRGAIVIWQHGRSSSGHTGIVLEYNYRPGRMSCIEGNTESGILNRDGGGVYRTERSTKANGSMKVVGFLKPF